MGLLARGTHQKKPRHRIGGGGCPGGPYFFSEVFFPGWLWDILAIFGLTLNHSKHNAHMGQSWKGGYAIVLGVLYPD
jgi:hypothetical protein